MPTRIATAKIKTVSPYCQGRFHNTPKLDKEGADAYEERTWRNKMHVTGEGYVFIPPLAFKNCIAEAAKYLSIPIKGKGKATYTKHFEAGILVVDDIPLNVKAEDVPGNDLFVPADGRRGSGKRVIKTFPWIPSGQVFDVPFLVLDSVITKDVFEDVLKQAGVLIGIGTFRPRNMGTCGRFDLLNVDWQEV